MIKRAYMYYTYTQILKIIKLFLKDITIITRTSLQNNAFIKINFPKTQFGITITTIKINAITFVTIGLIGHSSF